MTDNQRFLTGGVGSLPLPAVGVDALPSLSLQPRLAVDTFAFVLGKGLPGGPQQHADRPASYQEVRTSAASAMNYL